MLTIKTINKEINKLYPFLTLVKGEGYQYFIVEGNEIEAKAIGELDTSVYVYKLSDLTLKQWLKEASDISKQLHATNTMKKVRERMILENNELISLSVEELNFLPAESLAERRKLIDRLETLNKELK